MNTALIYRPNSRWLIWIAFACAIMLHLTAIALAENKSRPVSVTSTTEFSDIIGVDNPPDEPPQPDEEVSPPEQILPDNDAFPDESVTPRPLRPRKKTVASFARSTAIGTRATSGGSVKALALYAPKPGYPYEARRGNITGSGIAELTVNSESGTVIDARMSQSTGSAVLDNATIETLRRWRFKPGVAENVEVPITYTLTGVSY